MFFDDLFRKDRANKVLQITPSRLVAGRMALRVAHSSPVLA